MSKASDIPEDQESLFDVPEEEETPDHRAGRIAHEVFQEWYPRWYEGRYVQKPSSIMAILKGAVLNHVSAYDLAWAVDFLGRDARPITPPSLQYALAQVKSFQEKSGFESTERVDEKEYTEEW